MSDRAALSEAFVAAASWGTAERHFLAGDASARSYMRLVLGGTTAVLMDAPPEKGEETRPFVAMANHLRAMGLSAPQVLAEDAQQGFLLLEDLGDNLYARCLAQEPELEMSLYEAATDTLAHLQAVPAPKGLPQHAPAFMADAAGLAVRWYARAVTGKPGAAADLIDAMADAMSTFCTATPVLVLRDYHAENLLWLPDRKGLRKVGLLDFQMGSLGQPEYDLISLLQDARRDVAFETETRMITRFAVSTGRPVDTVATACAVLGAQRALRILGGFTRLSLHFGKPGYVRLIPRVWAHLQRNLSHPALEHVRKAARLPAPDQDALERIISLCGTEPSL